MQDQLIQRHLEELNKNFIADSSKSAVKDAMLKSFQKQYASENLLFLIEVHKLNSQKSVSKTELNNLYKKFIPIDSKFAINIPSDTYKALVSNIDPTLSRFSEAVLEIVKLVNGDPMKIALKDARVIAALDEQSNKEKLQATVSQLIKEIKRFEDNVIIPEQKLSVVEKAGNYLRSSPVKNMIAGFTTLLKDSINENYEEFKKKHDNLQLKNLTSLENCSSSIKEKLKGLATKIENDNTDEQAKKTYMTLSMESNKIDRLLVHMMRPENKLENQVELGLRAQTETKTSTKNETTSTDENSDIEISRSQRRP